DGGHGPRGRLDLRGGQLDDPRLGDAGTVCGSGVRHRGRPWEERKTRHPEVGGHAEEVFDRSTSPHSVRVCAEAHVVAESDRDLVQHPGAARAQAGELHVGDGSAGEDFGLYRLLQSDAGEAVQVDVQGPAAQRVKWKSWGRVEKSSAPVVNGFSRRVLARRTRPATKNGD